MVVPILLVVSELVYLVGHAESDILELWIPESISSVASFDGIWIGIVESEDKPNKIMLSCMLNLTPHGVFVQM